MTFWNKIFVKRAEDWTYEEFSAERVPEEPKEFVELEPDNCYITIRLKSIRIVNVRRLTKKFYGMVNSTITLSHTSGKDAVFQTVSTPKELKNVDSTNLDRVITTNITLVKSVPYRGGDVGVEIGLFSVEETDLAGSYLDLLSDIADKAGVGIVKTALPFAESIKKGVDAIIGSKDGSILEIGLSTTYNPVKTGWFVVMRAPKSKNLAAAIKISPTDFKLIDSVSGEPIKDYPYLVFSIQSSKEHPDWYKLPYLAESYKNLQDSVRNGKYEEADERFIVFKRIALTSDDLLFDDADRLAKLVHTRIQAVMKGTQVSNAKQQRLPELEEYQIFST